MAPHDELTFSVAVAADWPEIWPIFRDVVSSGDTYMVPPGIDEASARELWMPDDVQLPPRLTASTLPAASGRIVYIARLNGRAVGTGYLRPNYPGPGSHVANAGWMVAADCRGQGVGRKFAEYVIDAARRPPYNYRAMVFNAVVSTNTNAVALWQSLGFEIVGTVPDGFMHRTLGQTPVYVMYRQL